MVQSLEQYVAQANQAYAPATSAIQSQLGALDSRLQTTNDNINRQYEQQVNQLNTSRNQAAEAASMQAAGSGGSFGGAANIANRKYYEQSFVPAMTQLQTNQANSLATARQNIDDQRTNLNSQLSNLQAQANQQALAQYYSDLEAEKQREAQLRAQREAQAAQNAYYQYMMEANRQASQPQAQANNRQNVSFTQWLNDSNSGALNYASGNTYAEKVANLRSLANAYNAMGNSKNANSPLSLANTVAKGLQNSAIYNAYLRWRNS